MLTRNKPLVSVIVPAYNHELYITQTIESIVNQSYGYENIELIVIDDCSKDNTGIILKEMQKKYLFTLIHNEENIGVVKSLNNLLRLSCGKYVAGCASDDYWHSEKIKEQVTIFETLQKKYAVCHTNAYIVDSANNLIYEHRTDKMFHGKIFPQILIRNQIVAPSVMFRREIFSEVGFYDESLPFEDRDMWIRISMKYNYYHLDKCLVYRRQHSSNLSRNENKELSYNTFTSIFNKYEQYYSKYGLISQYHYLMFKHRSFDNYKIAIKHLLKSGKYAIRPQTVYFIAMLVLQIFNINNIENRIKTVFKKW